jgi:hypothetical protein
MHLEHTMEPTDTKIHKNKYFIFIWKKKHNFVQICAMLAETHTVLDFTCFEMRDELQSWFADSRPQDLVQTAARASTAAGIEFAG